MYTRKLVPTASDPELHLAPLTLGDAEMVMQLENEDDLSRACIAAARVVRWADGTAVFADANAVSQECPLDVLVEVMQHLQKELETVTGSPLFAPTPTDTESPTEKPRRSRSRRG